MVSQKVINADSCHLSPSPSVILSEAKDLAFRLRKNKVPSFT